VVAVERAKIGNVPGGVKVQMQHGLVLHESYICTARKPRCDVCIIRDICRYEEKTAAA